MEQFLERAPSILAALLQGARTTLVVTAGAYLLALAFGLALALVLAYGGRVASRAARAYVEVFRCTPALTQLFLIYFGLPEFGIFLDPLPAAILGLGMNGTAYTAEIFRAGINAIDPGQREAGLSVGLTPVGALRYVVMPQALAVVIPPLANYALGLLKDSAIVSVIAAPEIMFFARQQATKTFQSPEIYLLAALIYLVMSAPLSYLAHRLERARAVA
jgi:His/Glu/Gln/Arg/opine family amino acid ABC transporter permease subunit